jgi:type I restriction enzyme S subunit
MKTIVPEGYQETKLGIIPNDWEVKTFQSIFERVTRKNTVNNQNVLTISAQHGLVNQEDFFNKSVSSEDLSGYILLNKGEFAYNKSYSNGYPMGAIKRLKKYDQGVVSSLYIYFKAIKDEPEFYEHYFEAGMLNREIYKIAQEGARNHGLLNMSVIEFFKDLHVVKPPKMEQQKIAQILTTCDEVIVKQEKLVKEKKQLKKGLMQKLLRGQVRFDGFHDEWKEIHLTQVLKERKTYSEKGLEFEHVSLTKEGVVPKTERYERDQLVKDENKKYKITKLNDICYNPANLKFGVICKNTYGDGIFSPIYVTFEAKKGFDINFLGHFLTWNDFIMKVRRFEEGTVYERMAVNPKDFLSFKTKLPSLSEQQKIAEVLSLADDEINLLKNELEELKLQKKALMQKLLTGQVRVKV